MRSETSRDEEDTEDSSIELEISSQLSEENKKEKPRTMFTIDHILRDSEKPSSSSGIPQATLAVPGFLYNSWIEMHTRNTPGLVFGLHQGG